MSLGDFLQGFHQAFAETGGYDRLGAGVAKRAWGGEYYDPYQDPQFLQQYQIAQETGTPAARQQVAEQYGEHLDAPEDMTAQEYLFEPAEGTPQAMEQQMQEMQLQEAETQMDYLEPQLEQQLEAGQLDLDRGRFQFDLEQDYLPEQYDIELEQARQALDIGDLEHDITQFEFDQMQERAPLEMQQIEQQLREGEITLDQAVEQLAQTQLQTELMEEYAPRQYEAETAMQEEQLAALETENRFLEQQLEQQLTSQELQNINARIQNEMSEMQMEQQRQLFPYEVEQIENQILREELQNYGLWQDLQLQDELRPFQIRQQEIETQMMEEEADRFGDPFAEMDPFTLAQLAAEGDSPELWAQSPFSEYMGPDEFVDAFMGTAMEEEYRAGTEEGFAPAGFDQSDYAGTTPEGYPVYQSPRGGAIAYDPETGQSFNWDGEILAPGDDDIIEDAGFILYANPLISDDIAAQYAGQEMPLVEIQRLVNNLTPDYDISDMYSQEIFGDMFHGGRSYEEYKRDILGEEPETQEGQEIGLTPQGRSVYITPDGTSYIIDEQGQQQRYDGEIIDDPTGDDTEEPGFWDTISHILGNVSWGYNPTTGVYPRSRESTTEAQTGLPEDYTPSDLARQFINENPDMSAEELAQSLNQADEQEALNFYEETGITIGQVIDRLYGASQQDY